MLLCLFEGLGLSNKQRVQGLQSLSMASHYLQLFLYFLLRLGSTAICLEFNINRFDPSSNDIIYEGDATPSVGAVDFTSHSYLCHVGRITYAEKVRLWDSKSRQVSDITSRFRFTIDTRGLSYQKYGAGFAFFIAHAGFQIPVNSAGGFLGLYNTTYSDSSLNQIVHVEFDTYANSEWDPNYEHVGINKNSISSAVTVPWNVTYHSGDMIDALVTYNGTTKNLSVSWSFQSTPNPNETTTNLSLSIDLTTLLPELVTVGFSAATGSLIELHTLSSWYFKSSLSIDAGSSRTTNKGTILMATIIPTGFLLGGLFIILGFKSISKKRRRRSERTFLPSINDDDLEKGAGPRRFQYKDLASATNNFSPDRKLGEGGFGAVYRGYIPEQDLLVAVKKISRGSKQGKKEYLTEVKIISSLRHRNLVQLIGWCHDEGEFLLIYEYMPNGSLDAHLFGRREPLAWSVRYKISLGLGSALLYLHEEWEQCVVHRDIKSSNIMLDSNFNVKLGDFGLAKLMDHELDPQTTGLAGTRGYLAPEYISTGRASKESDVYSFGVVLLEITTGRRATDPLDQSSHTSLVEWVWDLYGSQNLSTGMDERMKGPDCNQRQAECLMILGLWCAHPDRNWRPTIKQAIQVMNFEADLPDLPKRMPVPVYHVPSPKVSSTEPMLTSIIEEGR
ncbi:hypothetical protein SAY87_018451 [Trapa incisa]|uniref:Protein kinase domain-containing protein n=1 Tax=Trapa incisa TaxID=236973 RepID=A0AAN7QST6_9MYRT|nr:hypothetical protein SAY87_018451 [Trapa incisa]